MKKRILAGIPPRKASVDEMQRFTLADGRCFFFHASRNSEDLLVLSVYHAEDTKCNQATPNMIVYFSKEDFINRIYDKEKGIYKWRTSCLNKLFFNKDSKSLLDMESKTAIAEFFGGNEEFFKVIETFQHQVLSARLDKKHQVIKDAIDKDMVLVPPLPKNFEDAIATKAMKERYMFYTYARRKSLEGFCTNCRQTVTVDEPRHNKPCKCLACGAKVVCKSRGKAKHGIHDTRNVCLPQKIKGGFVLRYFDTWRDESGDGTRKVSYHECRRILHIGNQTKRYIYADFKQTHITRWCHCTDDWHRYDGWVYPANLEYLMAGTAWQYSASRQYVQLSKQSLLSLYLQRYLQHPYMENFLKNNLPALTDEIVQDSRLQLHLDKTKTRIHELLMVSKHGLQTLQKTKKGHGYLEMVQAFERISNINIKVAFLDAIKKEWRDDAPKYIQYVLRFTSHLKAMRYADALKFHERSDWLDYAKMATEVGYNMREDHAIFPRNLKKAHDTVTLLHREMTATASEEDFALHTTRLKAFEWQEPESPFVVVAPQKAIDIVHEGHKLKHCVHGYIRNVIEGKCSIMFLRKKEKPNKPYVTMEIKNGRIAQYRGWDNKNPDEDTSAFVQRYGKWLAGGSRQHVPIAA